MRLYLKLIRPMLCFPGQNGKPKTELVEKEEEKWYPEEERERLEEKYCYLNIGHFSNLVFEEKYELYMKEQEEQEKREYREKHPCEFCQEYLCDGCTYCTDGKRRRNE